MVRIRERISGFCKNGMHGICDGTAYYRRGPFTLFEVKCRCPCHQPKLEEFAGGEND